MPNQDGDEATGQRLTFGRYALDLRRGCLLFDEHEIKLQPKAFAMLCYLVRHPHRLVSKDELLAGVWPGVTVSDDLLVQGIDELRRALGESGARLITTVPRRGYRFEGDAAPPERRKARNWHPLRWRWMYGILAPLALALTVVALWLGTPAREAMKAGAGAAAKPAIAVLPFRDQSDDASRGYLADGFTQDIIQSLGSFSALTVMSWNAVATYKGALVRPGEIARALAVRYQVEGSVRYAGDRLRVGARLVDLQGGVLWSASFEEALSDLFAVQDRITRALAGALAIQVTESERQRLSAKPTESLDAYDYLLRARPALQRPTRPGLVEARDFLRRAIALDPRYAAAHAALGDTFHVAISMGWAESPEEYWKLVEAHASEALRIDASTVRARILLARSDIAHDRYREAQAQIDRAMVMNPSDADALAGRGHILLWLGKTDSAIETLELAQHIDPELGGFDRFALALAYYLERRYTAAIEQAALDLRKNPQAQRSQAVMAAAYAQVNQPSEAAGLAEIIRRTAPAFDGAAFANKFLDAEDLEHLREGLRKAGLYDAGS